MKTDLEKLTFKSSNKNFFGLVSFVVFKKYFIELNRGKPIYLVLMNTIKNVEILDFLNQLIEDFGQNKLLNKMAFGFHFYEDDNNLLIGFNPKNDDHINIPNMDNQIGRFQDKCMTQLKYSFNFGIARTQCNYLSTVDEIFEVLYTTAQKNMKDNLTRWGWTVFNKANSYFSGEPDDAVIQPTVYYNDKDKTFMVKGGEVFVGGAIYSGYHELINDIPKDQEMDRIEILILEKLIIACKGIPGMLKFNMSPQTLIDAFSIPDRVAKFNQLLKNQGIDPENIRIELVEKPYEDTATKSLRKVCSNFYQYGVTFAADDFGVKSQSHQVILDLGQMIKEFKLDPISFMFKPDEDKTKFLDNLAFIEYCNRLADNRDAHITAEAVEDMETLKFLLEHNIRQFQAFLFCNKLSISTYKAIYKNMRGLTMATMEKIYSTKKYRTDFKKSGNIFATAEKFNLLVPS